MFTTSQLISYFITFLNTNQSQFPIISFMLALYFEITSSTWLPFVLPSFKSNLKSSFRIQ
jgi:hypothetical protein